jgi:Flp pilus assembly protein TadG
MVKDEKGQSLTEFALIVPILVLLVCGIFDFGRLMFTYLQLHHASQEAVRIGGLGRTDLEITTFARNNVHLVNPQTLQVTISPTDANRKSGQYVKVTLMYTLPFITPVLSKLYPSQLVKVDSTIRVE